MPKLKQQPKWVLDLREDIKDQQRFGWSVREKKGSVEVLRYWADTGKRQSAVLPVEWRRENKRDILNALHGINAALNKGLSLKDAVKLNFEEEKQYLTTDIYPRPYIPRCVRVTTFDRFSERV